ncbi:MAG: type II toxin-antitoxin system RelE/ParE family toxin [Gammaproteobacteria bacterium]
MKLKWTRRALQQLNDAQAYIARDNPAAAHEIAERIGDVARLLLRQPRLGRPGRVPGTYEWVIQHTPYLLVYVIEHDTLQILRVIHSKQNWPYTTI